MEGFILQRNDFFFAALKVKDFDVQNQSDYQRYYFAAGAWLRIIPETKFFWLSGNNLRHRYCVVVSRFDSTTPAEFARAAQEFARQMAFELLDAEDHKEILEAYTVQKYMNGNGN